MIIFMKIAIASALLQVIFCNYTILSKQYATHCKSSSSVWKLLANDCRQRIVSENGHLLVTSVMGLKLLLGFLPLWFLV